MSSRIPQDPAPTGSPCPPGGGRKTRRRPSGLFKRPVVVAACITLAFLLLNAAIVITIDFKSSHRARVWPHAQEAFWRERSWQEIERRVSSLPPCPRLARRVLGTVRYGRSTYPIYLLSFSPRQGSRGARALLVGSVHGSEPAGGEALLRLAEELARNPMIYPELTIDIVPVANPWGWVYNFRYDGIGEDVNRDYASGRTPEARILRDFMSSSPPYDLVMDLHESKKPGYFLYEYVSPERGFQEEYTHVLQSLGKPRENGYREGPFRTLDGVLHIPAAALPWISIAGRLSLDHYARLRGTPQSYTIETSVSDAFGERVEVHRRTVHAFLKRLNLAFTSASH